jgi:hypothetical protein
VSWWARTADRCIVAYYVGVCVLVLIPVILFIGAVHVAEWVDHKLGLDHVDPPH